jgi:hypothetical protein
MAALIVAGTSGVRGPARRPLRRWRRAAHADRGACRIGLREIFGHDLVDDLEVAEVGQVHVHLNGVREIAARRARDGAQVLEDAAHVRFDVARHEFHRLRVERDLAGQVDRAAGPGGLGIGADRVRRVGGRDGSEGHGAASGRGRRTERITAGVPPAPTDRRQGVKDVARVRNV